LFNEQNTVQDYIRDIIQKQHWDFIPAEQLSRKDESEVILEKILGEKLQELNPSIKGRQDRVEEVIYQLTKVIHSVQDGLVQANQEFSEWLKGEKSMRYGQNNQDIPIKLIDFNPDNIMKHI